MAPKRFPPNDPREWINRARSSLAHAKAISPEVVLEDLCFDAQQAAEKAIKAVFIHRGEAFPYSHDLDRLLRLLAQNGLKIAKYLDKTRELTRFADHALSRPGCRSYSSQIHASGPHCGDGSALGRTTDQIDLNAMQ
jgi:HEPN domain-containing protein